ncbi:Uncharacterized conserved protein YndB, AHSA1/START domain [Rhizobiales bacterium GAS191]|nr:Uncharacterized conserved protein YndB, AHSA1/START domain [Rhizobiales bacterium GAS191]
MTNAPGKKRTDSASRVIRASPRTIYRALLDPAAVASWRPPDGMEGQIYAFDPREGGTFRMSFAYTDADHTVRGKTSEHADMFQGRFLELVPDERVVELVEFESDDPAFAGAMTIITTLAAVSGGTEVTILCENVPSGIRPSDHQTGMMSTLKNLAAFTE